MRKNALFIAMMIGALSISACGKTNDKETEKTTVATTEVTTVETTTETESVTEEPVSETVTETESVTEEPTEETTKKRRKREDATKNETESQDIETEKITEAVPKMEATVDNALGFVGKTLSELTDAVGNYNSFETAGACFDDENELNGIAYYDNFTVYCHSENNQTKWVIDVIE